MNPDENLNGTLVLVRPDLHNDPMHGQGRVAYIRYASRNRDEIYIGFLDGREAFYQPAELFRLKDSDSLFKELRANAHILSLADVKALYKIQLLSERGTNMAKIQALELARDNPAIWEKALDTLPRQKQELTKRYAR